MIWINNLLKSFKVVLNNKPTLYYDNLSNVHIAHNSIFHQQTKNKEIDCHLVCDKYDAGFLEIELVSSKNQLTNLLNKSITKIDMGVFLRKLGVHDPNTKSSTRIIYVLRFWNLQCSWN